MGRRLSVVVCNHNHAHFLGRALTAIVTQSRRPDEIIVIDDASTDNSRTLIEAFCDRYSVIKPIFNNRNLGAGASFNLGMEMATGEYLFPGAADDCILPGFLENSLRLAEQYPDIGLVCSDPVGMNGNSGRMTVTPLPLGAMARAFSPGEIVKVQRAQLFLIPGHTSLYRRMAAVDAGLYLADLKWHCDWFMNLVIAFRYGIAYLPGAFSAMRFSPNSYSSAARNWAKEKPVLEALIRHLDSPRYGDVRKAFVESGVLASFSGQILRLASRNPAARTVFTPLLLWREIGNIARKLLRPLVPDWVLRARRALRSREVAPENWTGR